MMKFPYDFQPFINVVLRSRDSEQAFDGVQSITNVSSDTAKKFFEMFHKDGDTPRVAFKKFYDVVKRGKYQFDGEMSEMITFIKNNLLYESIDDYTSVLSKHDFYYNFSDDRSAASRGKQSEDRLRDIYKSLSDADKLAAAITYQNTIVDQNLFKNTEYRRRVVDWKPEENFDPNSFDGVTYRG